MLYPLARLSGIWGGVALTKLVKPCCCRIVLYIANMVVIGSYGLVVVKPWSSVIGAGSLGFRTEFIRSVTVSPTTTR